MKKLFTLLLIACTCHTALFAQALATYTGSGGNSTTVVAGYVNETVSALQDVGFGSNTQCQSGGLSGITVNTGITSYSPTGPHVYFSLMPDPGYTMNFTGFDAGLRESNTGPSKCRFAYSLDGGTTWIDDGIDHTLAPGGSCGTTTNYTWNGTLNVTNIDNTFGLIVAIYPFSSSNNGGTFQVNSITLSGSVVSCTPPTNAVITGNAILCGGNGNTFTVTANGSISNYIWKNNGAAISGATNNTYTITTPGTYTCTVKNSCGDSTTSNTVTVNLSTPPANVAISGDSIICGGTPNTLTVTASGGTSYQWRINNTTIVNATNTTYTSALAGYYICVVKNNCGDSTMSATFHLSNAIVPANVTIQGHNNICSGVFDTMHVTVPGAVSYKWIRNNVAISGATNATYITSTFGSYTCVVKNVCGDSATSAVFTLAISAVPVISISENHFGNAYFFTGTVSGGNTYSWSFGDGGTSTQQNPTHTYANSGTYTVTFTVTNAAGCSNTVVTSVHVVAPSGVNNLSQDNVFTIIPNPAKDKAELQITTSTTGDATITIYDISGKVWKRETIQLHTGTQSISTGLSTLPTGMYFVNLKTEENTQTQKLVIMQ